MRSQKPVKTLETLVGSKMYFFPDELSNERYGNDNKKCILLRINAKAFYIPTGERVELTDQQFAVMKDSSLLNSTYHYEVGTIFDPIKHE